MCSWRWIHIRGLSSARTGSAAVRASSVVMGVEDRVGGNVAVTCGNRRLPERRDDRPLHGERG